MPPPPRAREALVAMKNIGFSVRMAGPILKKLLVVYENNWEYIEQDGYQVLKDAILEEQEKKVADGNKQNAVAVDDPDYSRKRLRKQSENPSSMLGSDAPGETSLKKPKVEADASTEAHLRERHAEPVPLQVDYGGRPVPESPQADNRERAEPASEVGNREKKTEHALLQSSPNSERPEHDLPLITRRETRALARTRNVSTAQENAEQGSPMTSIRDKQPAGERPRDLIFKEPKIEPGTEVLKDSMSTSPPTSKDKEDDDLPEFEVFIAMIPPHHPHCARNEGLAHQSQQSQSDSSLRGISRLRTNATESLAAQNVSHKEDKGKGKGSSSDMALENGKASELVTAQEASSSTVDIASSDTGAVKLLFGFNSDHPDLRMPSRDVLFKTVEERCLKSYKILLPDFSLRQVMKDMCQIASELTTGPRNDKEENTVKGMLPMVAATSFEAPPFPSIDDIEEEFIRHLIHSFFVCLEDCLNFVLQGIRTPFASPKRILTNALDNIEGVGSPERAEPLKHLVANFERAVMSWRDLIMADLTPDVDRELAELSSEIEQVREMASKQMAELNEKIAHNRTEQRRVVDTAEVLCHQVAATSREIEDARHSIRRAEQIIEKARSVLARAEPALAADNLSLNAFLVRNLHLIQEEHRLITELEEAKLGLAQTVNIAQEDVKRRAVVQAEEKRKHQLAQLETKLRSYVSQEQ